MEAAAASVPARITRSWEHPNRQVREAHLWAKLQYGDAAAVKESWQQYEDSRKSIPNTGFPPLVHEVDRFIVGQAAGDESLKAQAMAGIAEGVKSAQGKAAQSRLCAQQEVSHNWRVKQRQARMQAAKAVGVCAKT